MKPQVVVVGSYVQDLSWRCASFPTPGQTVLGEFQTGPGGKGSNQAVASGRAGAFTCFVGAIGQDVFGSEAKKFYQENQIEARWQEKPRAPTGTAAILVNDEGQNEIVVSLGANARLAKSDLDTGLLSNARMVVAQFECNLGATDEALRIARKAKVTTLLNPAPMRSDFDPALLRNVDILVPNETEFAALINRIPATGRTDFSVVELAALEVPAIHDLSRKLSPAIVIITLGERGCLVSTPDHAVMIPSFEVEAVDTTGAGDAFVGGFAAGWCHFDGDITQAALFGNAVAALSVTKPGTAPSMPRLAAIKRFLRQVGA